MNLLSRLRAWLRPYPDDAELQKAMLRGIPSIRHMRIKKAVGSIQWIIRGGGGGGGSGHGRIADYHAPIAKVITRGSGGGRNAGVVACTRQGHGERQ